MNEAIERLLRERPLFHADDASKNGPEELVDWGIQNSFLRLVSEKVDSSAKTMETGSGLSTVFFAIIGSEHVSVSPAPSEFSRILSYCKANDISTSRLMLIPEPSQEQLPKFDHAKSRLDLALIDGAHSFPLPIIDFYYLDRMLKVGGLLAIDDLAIPTVGMLYKFIRDEGAYELVAIDSAKTALLSKKVETDHPEDWMAQHFNRSHPDFSFLPPRERFVQNMEKHLKLSRIPGLKRAYGKYKGK